jgi:diguanylate cyclase (GGDEF)-like protein
VQPSHDPHRPVAGLDLKDALLVGALVFICSIFGIYTAPPGVLAAFWPTNAVLVGLLLRRAHPPTAAHWLAAIGGYIVADLIMQHGWPKTLMLTTTNLMGVSVCHGLLKRMSDDMRGLRHPRSMLRFVLAALCGAAAAGVGGTVIHPVLFGGTRAYGFLFWFSTELVNTIAILPVLLTMPDLARRLARRGRRGDAPAWRSGHLAPLAAFAGSLWLETQLGGPGAISFPIPAMLWCALTYSLFATAGITLLFSMWTLLAIASGMLAIGAAVDTPQAVMSLRVGVTLTALAPLAVASVMVARNELLARLQHAASHDPLTQVLNRGGFMARADSVQAAAVLMMDIDYFKKVNDTHGHAAGDAVLAHFARVAAGCLRVGDVLGRLGGEEFAVLLPGCAPADARAIAQRICDAFAAQPAVLEGGVRLHATVSIGMGCRDAPDTPIGTLLSQADAALYSAKHAGRNRVVVA